jgi:hypothetical protein
MIDLRYLLFLACTLLKVAFSRGIANRQASMHSRLDHVVSEATIING